MKTPNLLHSIAALGSVQVANYLLPLITMPYVTRVLGVEAWGRVAFVQIVISYFILVSDWGFYWSATRKVAAARENLTLLSTIFIATWAAQWILAAAVILCLLLLISLVPFFRKDALLYLFGIGLIGNSVLFPFWFLNGLERMKQVATIQIMGRIVTLPFIFLLIKNPDDAPMMIAILVSGGMLSGIFTIYWIKQNITILWKIPTIRQVFAELKDGKAIFSSTIWISLYTVLTPTVLGANAGPIALSYYALADKVRQLAQGVLIPISQALFPRVSFLFSENPDEAKKLLKRSGWIIVTISSSISLSLWFGAELIVHLLAGANFLQASVVLKLLSPLPFVISISNLLGVQVILAKGMKNEFNTVLIIAAVISVIIVYPLILWKQEVGAAISSFIIQCVVTLGFMIILKKKFNWLTILRYLFNIKMN